MRLDDKTKREINEIAKAMKQLDNAGRALLLHDASLLVARQEIEQAEKLPA